jgi:hypothetical protein
MSTSFLPKESDSLFFNAYNKMLDAIVEKDFDFIRASCEPQLAQRFITGLEKLEKEGKALCKHPETQEPQYNVSYYKFKLKFGEVLDRSQRNRWLYFFRLDNGPFSSVYSFKLLKYYFSSFGKPDFRPPMLLSLKLEVETNVWLDVFDPKVRLHNEPRDHQLFQTHMLEFGFQTELKTLMEIGGKKLENPAEIKDLAILYEELHRLLSPRDPNWLLLNIDNHFDD